MKNTLSIFILFILVVTSVSLVVATDSALPLTDSSVQMGKTTTGVPVCESAMNQLREEATALFGFDPGFPTEIIEDRVIINNAEVPFGIVAKFDGIPFGYGRALPLNEFTHVRAIVVMRSEESFVKMSGIVYNQEVENPTPELLIGHLFPEPETWNVNAVENGIWDFDWVAEGVYWTGTYGTFLSGDWDCSASDTP